MVEVVTAVLCKARMPRQGEVRGVINKPTAAPTLNFSVPACPDGIIEAKPFGTRGFVVEIVAMDDDLQRSLGRRAPKRRASRTLRRNWAGGASCSLTAPRGDLHNGFVRLGTLYCQPGRLVQN